MKLARFVCLGALAGMMAFGDLSEAGLFRHSSGSYGSHGSSGGSYGSQRLASAGSSGDYGSTAVAVQVDLTAHEEHVTLLRHLDQTGSYWILRISRIYGSTGSTDLDLTLQAADHLVVLQVAASSRRAARRFAWFTWFSWFNRILWISFIRWILRLVISVAASETTLLNGNWKFRKRHLVTSNSG